MACCLPSMFCLCPHSHPWPGLRANAVLAVTKVPCPQTTDLSEQDTSESCPGCHAQLSSLCTLDCPQCGALVTQCPCGEHPPAASAGPGLSLPNNPRNPLSMLSHSSGTHAELRSSHLIIHPASFFSKQSHLAQRPQWAFP